MLAEAVGGTGGLIGGQVEDLESEGRAVSAAALERAAPREDGRAARAAAVVGGGILGGAGTDEQSTRLGAYAAAIGLAFQVVDDVLDATRDGPARQDAGKDAAAARPPTWRSTGSTPRGRWPRAARGRAGAARRRSGRATRGSLGSRAGSWTAG